MRERILMMQRAPDGLGHGQLYKWRDDGIVPLICPTCQNAFRKVDQGIAREA